MNAITKGVACGVLAMLAALSAANGPQSRPVTASEEQVIVALIAHFSSDDLKTRSQAEKGLLEIGDSARPFLEVARHSTDPEVAAHAEVILHRMGDTLNPTWVSIDVNDMPASSVIESLAAQAHEPLLVYQDAAKQRVHDTKLTIHAIHEPFWAVLLQVCEAVDLRPDCYMPEHGGWALREDNGTWDNHNTTINGPFAVHIAGISRQADIDYGNPAPIHHTTEIFGFCHAEKKVHAQDVRNFNVTRCEDENGKPIKAFARSSYNSFAMQGYEMFEISLDPGAVRKVSVIDGTADFVVETRWEHIEVDNLLHAVNVQRTPGPIRMVVRDCRNRAEQRWALRITIYRDGRKDESWMNLVNSLRYSPPTIEDSQERPLDICRGMRSKDKPEETDIEFQYANFVNRGRGVPTDPVKLVWDVPTRTQNATVPFHFEQIPVP